MMYFLIYLKKTFDKFLKYDIIILVHAGVAELADALDLGSSVFDVRVQVSPSAPFEYKAAYEAAFFSFKYLQVSWGIFFYIFLIRKVTCTDVFIKY